MRKSTFITIGRDQYKISLDIDDIKRLIPQTNELNRVHHNQAFHKEGFNAYLEILLIALSRHHPEITRDFIGETYTFTELDRAVVEVLQFEMESMPDICGHGPMVGNN